MIALLKDCTIQVERVEARTDSAPEESKDGVVG